MNYCNGIIDWNNDESLTGYLITILVIALSVIMLSEDIHGQPSQKSLTFEQRKPAGNAIEQSSSILKVPSENRFLLTPLDKIAIQDFDTPAKSPASPRLEIPPAIKYDDDLSLDVLKPGSKMFVDSTHADKTEMLFSEFAPLFLTDPDFETAPPLNPPILRRPLAEFGPPQIELEAEEENLFKGSLLTYPHEAPLGYTGPSGILPKDAQTSSHFVPVEDRWRSGFPDWDRYDKEQPPGIDYPYEHGRWYDPYNQNYLKGDFPILGQHLFMNFTGELESVQEFRQLPVATSPFESTVDPFSDPFFGDPNQYFSSNFFLLSFELFHGNAAFKPIDWQFKMTTAFNVNYLDTNELAVVNPDVRAGTTRQDDYFALQEYFFEWKMADLSPHYDFVSARVGSQQFVSDFKGFIFDDVNRGARVFGTRLANRDQFNIILFDQVEKDTNSQLNTFNDRKQNTLIMNYYRQDFIYPGYTAQASFHYNHDHPDFLFDNNNFLARPDPVGVFEPHSVEAYYLGFSGQGHIEKLNVSNAFYYVFGNDSMNPIGGKAQDISAYMAAVELSYDRDWARFRTSFFYASGDSNPNDTTATGFDTILDAPNFAGGEFSYWQRQQLQLFGVSLVQRESLVPDLRTSKFQGQSNFVNPGLLLFNIGMDFDITPKLKMITNANYIMFDDTEVLETYTFQDDIATAIGTDLSIGFEYRPLLSDNVVFEAGIATLIPDEGLKDLYGKYDPFTIAQVNNPQLDPLFSIFVQGAFVY
ncbi:hypothetical protein [Rubinisphaera italica]|uniref:Alginate export domain-containing protein n=1 Tax=Rubinisphaera italica TaxID=2527969 RepID=A0A5C5XH84_9PLAN|nr:hypothetical protein [Rubinisphaera italica]TWT61495.1 hypothetical protein Pan54_22310 [Rubinisphaera italica]